MINVLLDWAFTLFHSVLIVFNIIGWVWSKTRKLHLVVISTTLLSWTLLGIWHGWGYCPLTDWHWQILRKAGYKGLPSSYIVFLFQRFFGFTMKPAIADFITVFLAVTAFGISVWANLKPRQRRRAGKRKNKRL